MTTKKRAKAGSEKLSSFETRTKKLARDHQHQPVFRLAWRTVRQLPRQRGRPRRLALGVLVLLYQFTPLKIEWIGLVVVAIYAAVYALVFQRRAQLAAGAVP